MAEYNCSCRGVERIYDWGGRLCKIMNGGGGGGGGGGCSPLRRGGEPTPLSCASTQTAWQYHNVFDEICLTDYLLFSYSGYLIILFV